MANDLVTLLPIAKEADEATIRLNATPAAIAQMFCALHPEFKERFVRRQLESDKWKKMLRKECMCEHCLKFDTVEDELRSFVSAILDINLDDTARSTLEMTDEQLSAALSTALEFVRYRYPTHVLSTLKAQTKADEAGEARDSEDVPACDGCATHCCKWALSCDSEGKSNPTTAEGPLCSDCGADHSMSCSDCNLIFQVFDDLERRIAAGLEHSAVRHHKTELQQAFSLL